MICQYQLVNGPCWADIHRNPASYSGFAHSEGAGWMHWASPQVYKQGRSETRRIMLPCAVCGKLGGENPEHMERTGHQFRAQYG